MAKKNSRPSKLNWEQLLSPRRRKDDATKVRTFDGVRTEHERDYDRILFSAPVRRLADKTQVFPLDRDDSVHTRLTHSHEVSNLARSIGVNLAFKDDLFPSSLVPQRNVPAMLAAIGLAHDLGNPPFGHRGETSIQDWFRARENEVFPTGCGLSQKMRQDFLKFEGNAQTVRLLTRLQILNDDFGLNVTCGTLAALMKYTVGSARADKNEKLAGRRKPGFFESERAIVEDIWRTTGLDEGSRHPLTYIMEASDDIAYCVIDAEDAVKKGLVSYRDLVAFLGERCSGDATTEQVLKRSRKHHDEFRGASLSPGELNDLSMQMFRVEAIAAMVPAVTKAFVSNTDTLLRGRFEGDLIDACDAAALRSALKEFDKRHAYQHESVREIELRGHNAVQQLMDVFWRAITERKDAEDLGSERTSPFGAYVYSRISENYRRVFEDPKNKMPTRYKEAQLLTDMLSGMTDNFAIDLLGELKRYAE
jgi:dGTPase